MKHNLPAPSALLRISFLLAFLSLVFLPQFTQAQTLNLLAYSQVSDETPSIEFQFKDLGNRELLSETDLEFYSDEEVTLEFRITIGPDGNVKYVKPGFCPSGLSEHRKSGITALYQSRFAPSGSAQDQQVTVQVLFRKMV
ncbi:MAG: hypothetical protein H6581_21420 [Bacteroidia bacterium]|nr:hypothetical protein [Bacteroidia bacterium]